MDRTIKISLFFILLLQVILCNKEKEDKSGVVFTFDDQYISEWYSAKGLFNIYNIKVTHFINRPQNLTSEQVLMLKQLRKVGHEIACHSMNHINSNNFLLNHTLKDYADQEILLAIGKMKEYGFEVKSYAYSLV